MYIGYCINGNHPILKTILENEIDLYIGSKPILIIGFEKAAELYPYVTLANKIIDKKKKIYYSFSEEESEAKYQEYLDNFIINCFKLIVNKSEVVNVVKLEDVKINKEEEVFIYETSVILTITNNNKIFYINKEVISFFNEEFAGLSSIESLLIGCKVISWDGYKFYGTYLKANNYYKSKEQIEILLSQHGDVDLYMGVLCLNFLKELKIDVDLINLWQQAYLIEKKLSDIKVKVDEERVRILSDNDNPIMQNIYNSIEGDCIIQKYNGTNKTTGRIYPYGTGFSLQSLAKPLRDIIIAEPDCFLVEFDYKAFEYNILSQLCKFEIKGDPHLYMSQLLFKDNEHRDIGKGLNYSLLYGKSIDTVILETLKLPGLKLSKEELKEKLSKVLYPVKELQEKLEEELKVNKRLINYFGRNIYPEKVYACVNNYIQSTAADILIIKLSKLFDLLSKHPPINKIVLQSHDSVLLNLSSSTIEKTDIASDIKTLLESPEKGLIGKVDVKYGLNWESLT